MEGGRSADQQEVGSGTCAMDGKACGPGNEKDYEITRSPFLAYQTPMPHGGTTDE